MDDFHIHWDHASFMLFNLSYSDAASQCYNEFRLSVTSQYANQTHLRLCVFRFKFDGPPMRSARCDSAGIRVDPARRFHAI